MAEARGEQQMRALGDGHRKASNTRGLQRIVQRAGDGGKIPGREGAVPDRVEPLRVTRREGLHGKRLKALLRQADPLFGKSSAFLQHVPSRA